MKFRVIGANRATNARMQLEMEAESKAAAERKATQQGMSVSRVEDISDGYVAGTGITTGTADRKIGRMHPVARLVILLAAVAAGYFFLWPMIERALRSN